MSAGLLAGDVANLNRRLIALALSEEGPRKGEFEITSRASGPGVEPQASPQYVGTTPETPSVIYPPAHERPLTGTTFLGPHPLP